ncbi:RCC1 domain-containing protein [Bdellovibrio sp. BCCA]|uniref:RCC1 domain-containing protein n=1 Tax=Bdellovibrio sp. BCCA TaxID=3136281 RepID=UPI0030F1FA53
MSNIRGSFKVVLAVLVTALIAGCTKEEDGGLEDLYSPPIVNEFDAEWAFPANDLTEPCQGSKEVSGTLFRCFSIKSNITVPNSNCSGLEPKKINHRSPAGTLLNQNITCGAVTCGVRTMTCDIGVTTGPYTITCHNGYHAVGATCISDIAMCTSAELFEANATVGTKLWENGAYTRCTPVSCTSGYYMVTDGIGQKSCVAVGYNYYSFGETDRRACPVNSSTAGDKSVSIDDCICDRHYEKNDSVCAPVAAQPPKVIRLNDAIEGINRFFAADTGYELVLEAHPSSQSSIRIFDNPSCGFNGVPPIGNLVIDDGMTSAKLSLYPYPTVTTIYAVAVTLAGVTSSCVELYDLERDAAPPALNIVGFGDSSSGYIDLSDNKSGVKTPLATNLISAVANFASIGLIGSENVIFSVTADNTPGAERSNIVTGGPSFFTNINIDLSIPFGSFEDRVGNKSEELITTIPMKAFGAKKIVSGDDFICILTHGGDVRCHGSNVYGQIVPSSSSTYIWPSVSASPVGVKITDIAAGSNHLCMLGDDLLIRCQGNNSELQIGSSTVTNKTFMGGIPFTSIYAGFNNTCGISANDGYLYCWGANAAHQIGKISGTPAVNKTPKDFATRARADSGHGVISQIKDVSVGNGFMCIVAGPLGSEEVYCGGANDVNQLGLVTPKTVATQEADGSWGIKYNLTDSSNATIKPVQAVSVNTSGGCILVGTPDKKLYCWGQELNDIYNFSGTNTNVSRATEMLLNTNGYSDHPVTSAKALYLDKRGYGMCLVSAYQSTCWGGPVIAGSGYYGNPTLTHVVGTDAYLTDSRPTLMNKIVGYATTQKEMCAFAEDGSVKCWGSFGGTFRPNSGTGDCGTNLSDSCLTPQYLLR